MHTVRFVGAVATVSALALLALLSTAASADRHPRPHERQVITKTVKLPPACAKVRVSIHKVRTLKFAKVHAKPKRAGCSDHSGFGVVVLVRESDGEWYSDIEGSRLPCLTLFKTYPPKVVYDLFGRCGG